MAISITCSGCNTSFEVPENLAGKTIRCTSCKTQVTVPSAREAAVASKAATSAAANDGRKPFGHGTGAPAKSASGQQAMSLDDEAPAAKTAPAAKATTKPAPKSAAKPATKAKQVADEDDEEDEDEKVKPGKAEKKATFKGAPEKRRDDDDDDDDDDRPTRRKKKNEGAGGAMIAIIAVGAIGLAAIVGVGIWLATKSDDKPSSTASSTSNTSSTSGAETKPAGTPGRPAGNPGAAGMATGGTGAVSGEGGMGGMGAGGMGMGGMGPGPGPGGGTPFPVNPVGAPGPWATFAGDGFSADFPGIPAMQPLKIGDKTINCILVASPTTGVTRAGYESFPAMGMGLGMGMGLDEKPMVEAAFQWLLTAIPALKTMAQTDVTVDGHPGKDIEVIDSTGEGKLRIVAASDRVYFFMAGSPHKGGKPVMSKDDVNRFLNSVKITYRPGAPVAGGMPPGAVGMPPGAFSGMPPGAAGGMPPGAAGGVAAGMPPGAVGGMPPGAVGGMGAGMPPFGGASSEFADGNIKAKLEPFFTSAFDVEKKEVFTIAHRPGPGGRVQGTLGRYSYPDFVKAKQYKMASLGFRMAIDSQNELLYVAVATATSPVALRALGDAMLDRASAPADIAVYDLKAIREGKAADGKPIEDGSEIKAAWTVSLRSTVHGIELSPDGKNLYVLVHSATTKKSSLLLVDTAMKKEAKRADLPEPVRDLVSGGDGKTVLIIEEMNPKTKISAVRIFDTQLWQSIKSLPMRDSAALDVGPMTSGGMVVSVLPASPQPAGVGPVGPPMGVGMGPMGMGPMGIGMGPMGMGGPNGPNNQTNHHFQLTLVDPNGGPKEMDLGAGTRAANGGYVKFDPTNKKLFVGSWKSNGLDVYDVVDPTAASGVRLKTSLKTAKREPITGHFLMSPDGKYLLFNNGLVLDVDNLGGTTAAPAGGAPAGGMPMGGMPMGGMPAAGMPPAGMPMAAGAAGMVGGMPAGGMPPGGMPPPGGPGKPPKKDN